MIKLIQIGFILFFLSITIACDKKNTSKQNQAEPLSIEWHEGISISSSLKVPVDFKNVVKLGDLLESAWSYSFTVYSLADTEKGVLINSCRDYLNIRGKGYSPVSSVDAGPYMSIAMKCLAIQVLANARPAKTNHFNGFIFDQKTPVKLPKQMAFIASTSEHKRIMANPAIKTLSDVHQVKKVEKVNAHNAVFYHDSGQQDIKLVGKGDFNNDGVQDVLLLVQNDVSGGSFSSTHLYSLTRLKPGAAYVLLNEFDY